MSDISSCLLKDIYPSIITHYNEGSGPTITTGLGNAYCTVIKIDGSVTGSIIAVCGVALRSNGSDRMLSAVSGAALVGSVNLQGFLKLEERSTLPGAQPSLSGSLAFVNNELWMYGEL